MTFNNGWFVGNNCWDFWAQLIFNNKHEKNVVIIHKFLKDAFTTGLGALFRHRTHRFLAMNGHIVSTHIVCTLLFFLLKQQKPLKVYVRIIEREGHRTIYVGRWFILSAALMSCKSELLSYDNKTSCNATYFFDFLKMNKIL